MTIIDPTNITIAAIAFTIGITAIFLIIQILRIKRWIEEGYLLQLKIRYYQIRIKEATNRVLNEEHHK